MNSSFFRKYAVNPPNILKLLTEHKVYWEIPTEEKVIYLTFDDGPTEELTSYILDVLHDFQAKATFFCVGDNVIKHPHLFEQIKQEGHAVGNHTFHHLKGWKTTTSSYLEDIALCEQAFPSPLFRPPYGKIKPAQVKQVNKTHHIILWSTLTYDFDKATSPEECLQYAIKETKAGSIIVFHDNIKATINLRYALPRFLHYFSEKGFTFAPIQLDNTTP